MPVIILMTRCYSLFLSRLAISRYLVAYYWRSCGFSTEFSNVDNVAPLWTSNKRVSDLNYGVMAGTEMYLRTIYNRSTINNSDTEENSQNHNCYLPHVILVG